MEKVNGYLTDDGTFFDSAEKAELHEATKALRSNTATLGIDPDRLLDALNSLTVPIRRYLDAKDAHNTEHDDSKDEIEEQRIAWERNIHIPSRPDPTRLDREDTEQSETSPPPIQSQSSSRGQSVPHMGRRKRTEKI